MEKSRWELMISLHLFHLISLGNSVYCPLYPYYSLSYLSPALSLLYPDLLYHVEPSPSIAAASLKSSFQQQLSSFTTLLSLQRPLCTSISLPLPSLLSLSPYRPIALPSYSFSSLPVTPSTIPFSSIPSLPDALSTHQSPLLFFPFYP